MAESSVKIPRMRTAARLVEEIRAMDQNSCVSVNYVRGLVRSGAVSVTWAGRKALINLDDVLDVLRAGTAREEPEPETIDGIRRLDAKRIV